MRVGLAGCLRQQCFALTIVRQHQMQECRKDQARPTVAHYASPHPAPQQAFEAKTVSSMARTLD